MRNANMSTTKQELIAEIEKLSPGIFRTPELRCPIKPWTENIWNSIFGKNYRIGSIQDITRDFLRQVFKTAHNHCPTCHGKGHRPPGLGEVLEILDKMGLRFHPGTSRKNEDKYGIFLSNFDMTIDLEVDEFPITEEAVLRCLLAVLKEKK